MASNVTLNFRTLARQISIVENNKLQAAQLLQEIEINNSIPIIGITGPPGVGKSTLVDALLDNLVAQNKKIAILAVDPSSPFNFGALLGDRIRLSKFFNNKNVFIRSVASRGSLGGLSEKIIEITDVVRTFDFDYIFIETVGVGQSEVEIAGLADTTFVVLNPLGGDEIQMLKAGIIEIADCFIINKADLDKSDALYSYLKKMVHIKAAENNEPETPVYKTIATQNEGINNIIQLLNTKTLAKGNTEKKALLYTQKALQLIKARSIKNLNQKKLLNYIQQNLANENFNLYKLLNNF